jgi:hypothetical protein
VQAIILENAVRYGQTGDKLLSYLFEALGILEHFNIEIFENDENWANSFEF